MDRLMDRLKVGLRGDKVHGYMNAWIYGYMDGCLDGWMDVRMDGWLDG